MQNYSLGPQWCRLYPQGCSACATPMEPLKDLNGPAQLHLWLPPHPDCGPGALFKLSSGSAVLAGALLEEGWSAAQLGLHPSFRPIPDLWADFVVCPQTCFPTRELFDDLDSGLTLSMLSASAFPRYCGMGAGEAPASPVVPQFPSQHGAASPCFAMTPSEKLLVPLHGLVLPRVHKVLVFSLFPHVNSGMAKFTASTLEGWKLYLLYQFWYKSHLLSLQRASCGCSASLGLKMTSKLICFFLFVRKENTLVYL